MIRRTFDPAFLNSVINHPEVRPWVGGEGEVDVTAQLINPSNVALVNEFGGFILIQHTPGSYEVHSQFLPEGRGRSAREAMREGFDYMFTRTNCEQVITQVPDNNRAAAGLARLAGFRELFRRENAKRGPTSYMVLTIDEWAQRNAALEADGEWYHAATEVAVRAARPDLPDHPEDPAHNRAVGAAVRMVRAGNAAKGVAFYNRWAHFAGYSPIRLISAQPAIIDMSDGGLTVIAEERDGNMEIVLCQ
jgi:RimJ/RimL family protein N-acetyltransferase